MKTRNSNSAPRDSTQGLIRYCNYYLEFPDGEVWSDYSHIAGGLNSWIMRTAIWRTDVKRAQDLMRKGQTHWKDNNGVTHRMQISETACTRKWGLNRKIKRSAIEVVR